MACLFYDEITYPARYDDFWLIHLENMDRVLGIVRATTCLINPWQGIQYKPQMSNTRHPIQATDATVKKPASWQASSSFLKQAVIKPWFKKFAFNLEVLINYRPISSLQLLAKVVQNALALPFELFLNELELVPFQLGFWLGYWMNSKRILRLGSLGNIKIQFLIPYIIWHVHEVAGRGKSELWRGV